MKRIIAFILTVILTMCCIPIAYVQAAEVATIIAPFSCGYIPDDKSIYLELQSGFDFINQSSETLNWELALTGAVLSEEVYDFSESDPVNMEVYDFPSNKKEEQEEKARSTIQPVLINLGYTQTSYYYYPDYLISSIMHPTCCFGYKRIENKDGKAKNVFAIVVRGTHGGVDIFTDIADGGKEFFALAINSVCADFVVYAENVTGEKIEDLQKEDNYFFITGHSLGGAVANSLSATDTILNLAGRNKNKIYTYTFEAPHTWANNWLINLKKVSNAFNFKDVDDAVPNLPPWASATRFGTDLEFSVKDLDNDVFTALFPNAEGGSVIEAPKRGNFGWDHFFGGHHDMGLPLTYILQKGIQEKVWGSVYDVLPTMAGYLAAMRYPEGKVEKMEPIDIEAIPFTSPRYWTICACDQYNTEDKGAEIIDCGDYYEVKNCFIQYPYFIPQEIYDQFEDGYEFDLTLEDQNGEKDTIHNVVSYVDGEWILSDNGDPYDDARYVQEEEDGTISLRSFYYDGTEWLGAIYRGSLFFRKDCIVHDFRFKETETFEEYVTKDHPYTDDGWAQFQGGKNASHSIFFNGKVIFDENTGMITECQEIYQL